ncbi:MAG: hypothetical protein BZ138_03440 [Methanosphaera sp. rholeuAM270]|nr:MAG: hypothetical protein BZ138_03440 [Methanosphaera sp. rholeuAM270]
MKLTPLQMIIMLVILAGIAYGTYSATMAQLPDVTGTIIGNTSSNNQSNIIRGTIYVEDDSHNNISIIISNSTKIYKESSNDILSECKMSQLTKNSKVEVHTVGDATNTIPPQIVAEKIIIKKKEK